MHHLIARLRVKRGHQRAFDEGLARLLPKTHEEPGCLFFEAYRDPESESDYWLVERWTDQTALEAHYAQPYVRAMFDHYDEWLEGPAEIVQLEPFGG